MRTPRRLTNRRQNPILQNPIQLQNPIHNPIQLQNQNHQRKEVQADHLKWNQLLKW